MWWCWEVVEPLQSCALWKVIRSSGFCPQKGLVLDPQHQFASVPVGGYKKTAPVSSWVSGFLSHLWSPPHKLPPLLCSLLWDPYQSQTDAGIIFLNLHNCELNTFFSCKVHSLGWFITVTQNGLRPRTLWILFYKGTNATHEGDLNSSWRRPSSIITLGIRFLTYKFGSSQTFRQVAW